METQPLDGSLLVDIPKRYSHDTGEADYEIRFVKTVYTPPQRNPGAQSEPL